MRKVLNIVSYDIFEKLDDAIENKKADIIINLVNEVYNNGYELHQFVRQYLDYASTKNFKVAKILVNLLNEIRYDESPKVIIIARFITSD